MKKVVTYTETYCDICGNQMHEEPGRQFVEGIYIGDKYVSAVVDTGAFYLGSETRCLCNNCKKEILQKAIERLT